MHESDHSKTGRLIMQLSGESPSPDLTAEFAERAERKKRSNYTHSDSTASAFSSVASG